MLNLMYYPAMRLLREWEEKGKRNTTLILQLC